ncbi:MAG: hypothetical protein ACKO25_09560 [Cyanobium sp.]
MPPAADGALEAQIDASLAGVEALASELSGQPEALLTLLRRIESLHRRIQDGPFRACLPEDRNRLFELLAEMERSGGWPYIPRLQLRTFLDLLQQSEDNGDGSLAA